MTARDKPISIDITMMELEESEYRISMEFADVTILCDPPQDKRDSNDDFFHRAADREGE